MYTTHTILKMNVPLQFFLAQYFWGIGMARPHNLVQDQAEKTCNDVNRGIYNTGTHWCCLCPAGHFLVEQCRFSHPNTTTCNLCPFNPLDANKQTYLDKQSNETMCYNSCNESCCNNIMNSHRITGTINQNSWCACDEGYHTHHESIIYGCFEHSKCKEGYEPIHIATNISDTKCKPCSLGFFSNTSSATDLCKKYSVCASGNIIKEVTQEQDVVCNYTISMNSTVVELTTDNNMTSVPQREISDTTFAMTTGTNCESFNPVLIGIIVGLVIIIIIIFFIVLCFLCKRGHERSNEGPLDSCNSAVETPDVPPNTNDEQQTLLTNGQGQNPVENSFEMQPLNVNAGN